MAVRNNRTEVLGLLLDYGFDPDERVSTGEGDWVAYSQGYPLWYSAALGRVEMAEMLLRHGADPNVHVDSSGSSVYSAYSHKQWEMVELLRRHGGVERGYGGHLPANGSSETDAGGRGARGAAGGDCGAGQAGGGGVAALWGGWRGCGDCADVARTDRLAARRRTVVRIATEALGFWHFIPWLYAGNKELDRGT